MYLITGSTGHIGRPLVEQLHKEGHDVRALVRDASRAEALPDGIDIAVGNLDDADSVAAALRGVDSVFLLHVGPGTTQTQIMIDAARSTGVDRIVLLSSVGARLIPIAGLIPGSLAAREDLLRASGLDVTYLRPNLSHVERAVVGRRDPRKQPSRRSDRSRCPGPSSIPTTSPESPPACSPRTATSATATSSTGRRRSPSANRSRSSPTSSDTPSSSSPSHPSRPPRKPSSAVPRSSSPKPCRASTRCSVRRLAGQIADDIENLTGVAPRSFPDWCERHVDEFG